MTLWQNVLVRILFFALFLVTRVQAATPFSAEVTRSGEESTEILRLHCDEKECHVIKTYHGQQMGNVAVPLAAAQAIVERFTKAVGKDEKSPEGSSLLRWTVSVGEKTYSGNYLKSELRKKISPERRKTVDAAIHLESDLHAEIIRPR